jgi:hypothetical protein
LKAAAQGEPFRDPRGRRLHSTGHAHRRQEFLLYFQNRWEKPPPAPGEVDILEALFFDPIFGRWPHGGGGEGGCRGVFV